MTLLIRPMRSADLPVCEELKSDSFWQVAVANSRRAEPEPQRSGNASAWVARTHNTLQSDPEGCWVAESGARILGFATSMQRELMWLLATFAVRQAAQGQGIGTALLQAAQQHGRGCLRGMLSASADPRAVRAYHRAGFAMHPQMRLSGRIDRGAIPALGRVREANPADIDLMNSVDRATRGAGHGPDHESLFARHAALVLDSPGGSGYAFADDGYVALLAATSKRIARDLLWECLARSTSQMLIPHVTAANQWVLEIGLAARLDLHQDGYLGLKGMKPPSPYIHNGALL